MFNLLKSWWCIYLDCMCNAHLIDEAYIELNMDEELGRGQE